MVRLSKSKSLAEKAWKSQARSLLFVLIVFLTLLFVFVYRASEAVSEESYVGVSPSPAP